MNQKRHIITFIAFLLAIQPLIAQTEFAGEFIDSENNLSLILKSDNNFLIINNDPVKKKLIWHLDTVGYGSWQIKKGFIILNTPDSISTNVMTVQVEEIYIPDFDSLKIEIFSPYEEFISKHNYPCVFEYEIYFDELDTFDTRIENSNTFIFKKHKDNYNHGFSVWIIPDSFVYDNRLAFNYLQSRYYSISNQTSNYFKVYIPNFTKEYIAYYRYKEEYVKIINKNKLQLRGNTYKRKK